MGKITELNVCAADGNETSSTARSEGMLPFLRLIAAIPRRPTLFTNLIIAVAVALFVYFLKQTPFLEQALYYLEGFLSSARFALFSNKFNYAPSYVGMAADIAALIAAAATWTYIRGIAARLLSLLAIAAVAAVITLALFRFSGVLVSSFLIVMGITSMAMLEAVAELAARRFRSRILEEKQDAEFNVIRHLTHNVKPNIQIARSPIMAVRDMMGDRGLLDEVVARRLDGSAEAVDEAIRNALLSLDQINDILDSTRRLVTQEIRQEEFCSVDLRELFSRDIVERFGYRLAVRLNCPAGVNVRIHRQSFVEAMNNIVRNAEIHGFPDGTSGAEVVFSITDTRRRVVIDYSNNGRPFPDNLTARDFLSFGGKSADSPGEGLGGAWIGKVLAVHGGTFDVIRDGKPTHFRITIPR